MLIAPHLRISIVLFCLGIISANLISHHVHPFRTFYNELAMVLGLLSGAIVLFSKRNLVPQAKLIYLPLAVLLMLVFQFLIQQVYAYQIAYPILYFGLCILAIFFGALIASDDGGAQYLCKWMAIAHLLVALLSVVMETIQVLGWDMRPLVMYIAVDGLAAVRPFANIAQPNQLALLLCFGLAGLWWLRQQRLILGQYALISATLIMWGLALTQSRIAWLILPIFVLLASSGIIGKTREHIFILLGLLCFYALLVFYLPTISSWMGFSSGSVIERIGGRSERTVLARQAIAMVSAHPWLGVGWFGFGSSQVDIGADFTPTIYAEHSHNLILNFAAELGLPFALVFFGALIVWFCRTCFPKVMRTRPEVGLFCMFVVAVTVHSLVEFPLWYAFVLIPIAVLAGLIHGIAWSSHEPRILTSRYLQLVSCFGIIITAFVCWDFRQVVDGFLEFRRAKTYAEIDVKKITRPPLTLMPDYYDYFHLMRVVPSANMSPDEIKFVEVVSHRFGYVHILSKLAEVYALNGRHVDAVRVMKTLHRLHPFYYGEYYDYWKSLAKVDVKYEQVFLTMPAKE